ncbi:exodeoxyribonuclease III [Desulfosporosinus sp. FKB]|uniref:exodeoxyribonuclease III n=1 Tax=Desulfosporosinus sp. FKB TaxID=1969835 RepID=UPI000B49729B|nr:exodeoxyribonuclease III [Desulfosporosinus sp. FKB]
MKLISWNVNGLRACLTKGFLDFFNKMQADIFCIQEAKLSEGQIELTLDDYTQYYNFAERKGYSGTVIFTRNKPINCTLGLGIPQHDREGRIITLEYDEFFLVNVYAPNSQTELARLEYRLTWEDDFRRYIQNLDTHKPVIFCGDLNVAHQEIDLKNPQSNKRNPGFTDEERSKFSQLLESGFVDTYRHFFPEQKDAYSWWSYRFNARARNAGWRIDYFCTSERLTDKLVAAKIYSSVLGSDHCPVGLETRDF